MIIAMKVFSDTCERVRVTVDEQPLDPRIDLRDFKASGFEWGYEGSGPLAILAEHAGPQAAPGNYRRFVQAIIAEIEADTCQLTSTEIDQRIDQTTIVPMDLKTLIRKVKGDI